MRLCEIVNTEYSDTEYKKTKHREIGKGRYAAVTQPDDFSVNKTARKKVLDVFTDPYYVYIKTIADNKLADSNPYFPRVNGVESGKIGDSSRPTYNMEKLQPISSLPRDILYNLGKQITNLGKHYDQNFTFQEEHNGSGARAIISTMNRALHTRNLSEIKDPRLKSAISELIKIREKYPKFKPDLHPDNVMVRLTSVGPQLVLTDPLH